MAWICLAAALTRFGEPGEAAPRVLRLCFLRFAMAHLRFPARELFPALHDHVAVERIQLHQERLPPRHLRADQRTATSPEQIQDMLPGPRRVLHGPGRQLYRLLGEMDHALWVDLLNSPDIRGVIRSEKLMGGPFSPPIKAPLMIAHIVFPRQDRMHFLPNDRLREIQARGPQYRRIRPDVRITAPEI